MAATPELPGITLVKTPFHRGPLAAVYRGRDHVHHREVVVKVQRTTDDPVALNRFRREAAVMSRLRHPGIVTLYSYHEADPAALVMEYIPGETLAALVGREGFLPAPRAARIVEEIAAALDSIHALGIVHRDVKPSNILLAKHGPAKLTDFGVARLDEASRADDSPLTVMGDVLGTIEYASPEQVHGNEVPDTRSDVYSLAAVAYFALTGTPPFRAADNSTQAQLSVMHRQVFAAPPPLRSHRPELSPGIEEAILRGLAKAPDARYASAGQLAAALRAAVEAASGQPEQRAVSRRPAALAGALAGAAALLLAGIALLKIGTHAPLTVSTRPPSLPPTIARQPPLRSAQVHAVTAHARPAPLHSQFQSHSARLTAQRLRRTPPPHLAAARTPRREQIAARRLVPLHSPTVIVKAFRASAVIAPTASSPAKLAAPKQTLPKHGWLQVFADQNTAPWGRRIKMTAIQAHRVLLDGKPAAALADGRWLAVPPGQHIVSFLPDPRSGFGPRSEVVRIASGAHIARQILLPLALGAPSSPSLQASAAVPARAGVGWYTVSGWISLPSPAPGGKLELIQAAAQWIKVDGKPVPPLALGQWAALPAGTHTVTFQPLPGLGVGPKTWAIDLTPQAHLSQQVPLPPAPLPSIPPHLRNP